MDEVRQRFAVVLPVIVLCLNMIQSIENAVVVIAVILAHDVGEIEQTAVNAIDIHGCVSERVIVAGLCRNFHSKHLAGFLVHLARQMERCTRIEVRGDDAGYNIGHRVFASLLKLRQMEHIHDILDVVVKGTDLRDDVATTLQFEYGTAEVKLNLVLIQKTTVAVFYEGDFDCFVLGGRFGQKRK